ncbi:mRNA capping enzyme family protein [Leishmania donovani]|uniref:mRNA (guanine-N(7))-methyltransferase n=1 Tax=Leishmania donovani TaxID=5661 RepID=A0A504X0Z2_LEIDO|nr:mRNA capping enzyme family protein [Leishmania donovani]
MLNVNAKAFVPPGVIEGAPPSFHTIGWYRYRLSVPVERKMSVVQEDRYLNSISSLLSLKYLYAERGGLDDDSLQYFLNGQFMVSSNIPSNGDEEHVSSGFLLSRSILTLYTELTAVAHLNDSRGLLVHLDLPTEFNGDVAIFLANAWEAFFAAVSENASVSAIGYSRSVVGMGGIQTNGTYRHYFFAACTSPESLEVVVGGIMSESPVSVARIVRMKSVVPYLCSPHLQLGVMITVGEEAKLSAIKDRRADFSLEMKYRADDFFEAWKALRDVETQLLEILNGDVKWDRIHVLHLHVDPAASENPKLVDTPVFDHSNMGLVFTPSIQLDDDSVFPTFVWLPPTSLTVRFSVEKVVVANEMNEGFDRAYLGVSSNSVHNRIIIPYEGEFADYQREAYPTLAVGSIVECLLRRADDGAHWWDVLQDFDAAENCEADSFDHVDELVHSPGVTQDEMLWLLKAPSYQCERCHKVNDVGRRNSRHNAYWCKNCWIETGHGDCMYCGRAFALGMLDGTSNLFYCEECWRAFSTFNTDAEIGYHVPPPPNATFTQQVTTRCVSLLIDLMNPKTPSNDVLDLCCGGSVVRKWMRNKTLRYVGIDLKRSVVDATTSVISSSKEMPTEARYDVICGDVFSDDFWMSTIVKIHPRQFHVINCFAGLHHAFCSEEKARHFLGSIANALVPGGTFLGMFIDASVLFAKGKKYANSIMKAGWSVDSVPRIGHTFQFTTNNGPMRDVNVIPIDFLIAVASEYGLHAVSEAYLTFRELIEKDPSWTKVPSADEKEYLCARRTFAFKKESNELAPFSPARKSDTA